ncbi:MAG: hypothetical protein ACHQXJ_02425 [Nitrososphaerales archaeon]
MGTIDVSDILSDPDLVDPLVLVHRSAVVDSLGKNRLKESGVATYGSVQPASGKTLQRIPEAFRVANVMSFWIRGKIVSDGYAQYPDIIVYKGTRFAVQLIFDWTNWGDGWTEGTAVREKPSL